LRRKRGAVQFNFGIELGARIARQHAPKGECVTPRLAFRRKLPSLQKRKSNVIRRDHAGSSAEFQGHVTERQSPRHRHAAHGLAGELDRIARAAGGTILADEREDYVLGVNPLGHDPVEIGAHGFRLRLHQRLRNQRMFAVARADAKSERAHRPDRAGVTVAADESHAGQRDAEFRRDDVHDSLPRIVDIEEPDVVRHDPLDELDQEIVSARHARGHSSAGHGCQHMIQCAERQFGIAHAPLAPVELFERYRAADLIQEVPVDMHGKRTVAHVGDQMVVPNLVE
jgi:hypothetical protein